KLFGNRPDESGVYGYSSWNDGEGIVSFRNAGDKEQTYELTLDDVAGVPTDLENAKMVQILPRVNETDATSMDYGDEVKVTLDPHEARIYQFTTDDKEAPKVQSIKSTSDDSARVKFNQRIQNPLFTVNGKTVDADILDDYRTVDITVPKTLAKKNTLELKAENIWGVAVSETEEFLHYDEGTAAALFDKTDLVNGEGLDGVHFKE